MKKFLAALLVCIMFWALWWATGYRIGFIFGQQNSIEVERTISTPAIWPDLPTLVPRAALPHYNLAVIKDGLTSIEDFKRHVQDDAILYSRFANFDWASARIIQLPAMRVFVSFRRGNQIFWTKGLRTVESGAWAITDGHTTVLMRCGNEISFVPERPNQDLSPGLIETPETDAPPAISLPSLPPDITTAKLPLASVESLLPPPPIVGATCCYIDRNRPTATPEPPVGITFLALCLLALALLRTTKWPARASNKEDL